MYFAVVLDFKLHRFSIYGLDDTVSEKIWEADLSNYSAMEILDYVDENDNDSYVNALLRMTKLNND